MKTSTSRLPPDEQLGPYLLVPSAPLVWPEIFGNTRPVEVEVGSGKGLFLVSMAGQFPSRNFFGIEIAGKFARSTASRLAKRSLTNACIAQADARRVVGEWIPQASVAAVHVYFPDPWWKRRHKKRRIFTDSFIAHVARILERGGELRVATDVEQSFHEIQELIGRHPVFVLRPVPPDREPQHDLDYLTNFERKYRKAGRRIFLAVFAATGPAD